MSSNVGGPIESRYLEGDYLAHNPTWHAEDAPFKARWISEILDHVPDKIASIAEVGCGSGEILVELQKRRPDVRFTGFEISPQAMEICRPKANDRLEFFLEDALESPKGGFDVVMAIDVFEHVPDYMSFLTRLRTKGTYKVFHIPLDMSVQGVLRETPIRSARTGVGHLHYFCKYSALATLKDCGYELLSWNYTSGAQEIPTRPLRTKLMNIPRSLLKRVNEDFAVRLLGGHSMMVLAR